MAATQVSESNLNNKMASPSANAGEWTTPARLRARSESSEFFTPTSSPQPAGEGPINSNDQHSLDHQTNHDDSNIKSSRPPSAFDAGSTIKDSSKKQPRRFLLDAQTSKACTEPLSSSDTAPYPTPRTTPLALSAREISDEPDADDILYAKFKQSIISAHRKKREQAKLVVQIHTKLAALANNRSKQVLGLRHGAAPKQKKQSWEEELLDDSDDDATFSDTLDREAYVFVPSALEVLEMEADDEMKEMARDRQKRKRQKRLDTELAVKEVAKEKIRKRIQKERDDFWVRWDKKQKKKKEDDRLYGMKLDKKEKVWKEELRVAQERLKWANMMVQLARFFREVGEVFERGEFVDPNSPPARKARGGKWIIVHDDMSWEYEDSKKCQEREKVSRKRKVQDELAIDMYSEEPVGKRQRKVTAKAQPTIET